MTHIINIIKLRTNHAFYSLKIVAIDFCTLFGEVRVLEKLYVYMINFDLTWTELVRNFHVESTQSDLPRNNVVKSRMTLLSSSAASPARGAPPVPWAQLSSTSVSTGKTTWGPHARENEKATGIWKRVDGHYWKVLAQRGCLLPVWARSSRPYQPALPWQPLILVRAEFLPSFCQRTHRIWAYKQLRKGLLLRTLAPHFCTKIMVQY